MFCNNCGKQINDEHTYCQYCGCKVYHDDIDYQQPINNQDTYQQYSQNNQYYGQAVQYYQTPQPVPAGSYINQPYYYEVVSDKGRAAAALLAFFLGGFGAHRFYVGRTGSAIAMLLVSIFGIMLSIVGVGLVLVAAMGSWALVDFIFILCGSFTDGNGRFIKN